MAEGYVLYVGTLEPRKNVATLLDAWEALRREEPATPPLVLTGGRGWGGPALGRRIEGMASLGVRALGRVAPDELVRLFQGAAAFVYPSLYEGFGLPPLEAMACGVPTVVSNSSSLPEVVGDGALQVDPGDPGELAQALGGLLADPGRAAALARRGLERAALFRWDRAARQMEDVFAEALLE